MAELTDELLRAVLERPDDEGARLVYADALQLAGDPRGELIAHVVAGAAIPPEVAYAAKEKWLAAIGDTAREVGFANGFPEEAELHARDMDGEALACLDRAPIRHFRFVSNTYVPAGPAMARWFAADPRTSRVRSLDVRLIRLYEEGARALLAPDLSALRTLWVGDGDGDVYLAEAIVENPTLSLERLCIFGDTRNFFSDGLALVADGPRSAALRELRLRNAHLTAHDAAVIAASPHLAELVRLELRGNPIGDAGLHELARAPLDALTELAVGDTQITDAGLASLADPRVLPRLRDLALTRCAITAAGLAPLVATRPFEALYLGGCRIGDAGASAIARSPHAGRLRRLNLDGAGVGADGVRALIASPMDRLDWLAIDVAPELQLLLRERFGRALDIAPRVR